MKTDERPFADYRSERLMRQVEATPLPQNVAVLLRERAAQLPNERVLNFFDDGEALTYGELADRVARLASGFSSIGVRRGSHVGVMVYTCATYPITWLALASLGAVTVPINFNYTPRELQYMLTDSQAQHLVIEADLVRVYESIEHPPLPDASIIVVGGAPSKGRRSWQSLLQNGDAAFRSDHEPQIDDLMNIQYTSGTTGMPKGAMLPHRYWLTFGRVGAAQIQDDVKEVLIAQPFYYVDAQWMFLMAVFQGGTAHVARKQSASRFFGWVKQFGIHFCNFPEVVSRAPETPADADNKLKVLYSYSHQLPNYRAYEKRYGCLARQGFSMTEIGIGMYVPYEADHMTGTGTVGIPAAFRETMVADPQGKAVADGELGELCVRGIGMFQGYYNKAEATKSAFHADGWFRTGDLGRRSPEGWFWYLGRMKDMVKRSGENVSATEVEAVLRGVDGVLEAAVLPVPDTLRGEEVKAYLLLEEGRTKDDVSPASIGAHCAQNLAKFKIPRYLEYVTEFPRTPSLKIKKSALIAAKPDLRIGSYDCSEKVWR